MYIPIWALVRDWTLRQSYPSYKRWRNRRRFFLYVAFSHVHQLCAPGRGQWVGPAFANTSARPFDDAVAEMDWLTGEVMREQAALGEEVFGRAGRDGPVGRSAPCVTTTTRARHRSHWWSPASPRRTLRLSWMRRLGWRQEHLECIRYL